MRYRPCWPGLALLAGSLLAACQAQDSVKRSSAQSSAARIPDRYELIDLGTLEGDIYSYPMNVNNRGEVVGMSSASYDYSSARGFYWNEDEGMTDLGTPPGYDWVWADEISDRGLIVGTLYSSSGEPTRGFLWENGQFDLIEAPQGTYSEAWGVNRNGEVVGMTEFTPGYGQAFVLRQGELLSLPELEGAIYSIALAINRNGDIIGYGVDGLGGYAGLLWVDGGTRLINLSEVLSVPDFIPYAISREGDLAGYSPLLGRGIFVGVGGQATDLGSLEGPDGYSEGWGINRTEQVVGISSTAEGGYHAFIWEDGEMVDLNELIDPDDQVELLEATSINDDGEITALGLTEGVQRAFLLRPR